MTRRCPLCGLSFHYSTELETHARDDHPRAVPAERVEHITRYLRSGRPVLHAYRVLM